MSTAQERLQSGYYNSAAVSGANPGGLASGGHVPNFPAALQDMGVVAQDVGGKASAVTAAAQSAGQSAAAASQDRVLAQQAAQAASQFDPTTKVSKTGDTMSGDLFVRANAAGYVGLHTIANGRTGHVAFYTAAGVRTGYAGYADATANVLTGENGRGWNVEGLFWINGSTPFTNTNDGSGSGLDADLLRGLAPSSAVAGNSLAVRNSAGECGFRTVYLLSDGGVMFDGGGNLTKRDADTLQMDKGLYLTGALSASVVTERSDRRLKSGVEPLDAVEGRLKPVRYVLRETGESRVGFIAQDIAQVRPEAVQAGTVAADAEGDLTPMLEVSTMALIAHLARQVNDLQDRLDKAGL